MYSAEQFCTHASAAIPTEFQGKWKRIAEAIETSIPCSVSAVTTFVPALANEAAMEFLTICDRNSQYLWTRTDIHITFARDLVAILLFKFKHLKNCSTSN